MTIESTEREVVVAERPAPGTPRPYAFPSVARAELENGLTILIADLPPPPRQRIDGRPGRGGGRTGR